MTDERLEYLRELASSTTDHFIARELIAEIDRLRQVPQLRTFHNCVGGSVRPYSVVLCSSHRGVDESCDFDAVDEIIRLRLAAIRPNIPAS